MPIKDDREYRVSSEMFITGATEKKFNSDFYIEGFATTFDKPYLMGKKDGISYYEMVDSRAFDDADMSDVIMQFNHNGKVFARMSNDTLGLEVRKNIGLFNYADLSKTSGSKELYEDISSGLITKMSIGFRVVEGSDIYDRKTHTRTITKIEKLYDVSAVSLPANNGTDIYSVRSYFDGLIELEKRELLEQEKLLELAKRKFYFLGGK